MKQTFSERYLASGDKNTQQHASPRYSARDKRRYYIVAVKDVAPVSGN